MYKSVDIVGNVSLDYTILMVHVNTKDMLNHSIRLKYLDFLMVVDLYVNLLPVLIVPLDYHHYHHMVLIINDQNFYQNFPLSLHIAIHRWDV